MVSDEIAGLAENPGSGVVRGHAGEVGVISLQEAGEGTRGAIFELQFDGRER